MHMTSCGHSVVPVNLDQGGIASFAESLPAGVFPLQRRSLGLSAGDAGVDVTQGDGLHVA